MTIARTLLAATAALFIGAGAAQAEAIHSPEGQWVTNGGESKYEISLCGKRGDSICAKLIWADDSALGQKLKANIVKTDILEVPRTGNQRWKAPRNEVTSWATPIIVEHAGQSHVVVSGTSRVRGYDLATGKVLWECGGLSSNIVASPVAGDGMVFAGSSYDERALLAIRLDGAAGVSTRRALIEGLFPEAEFEPSRGVLRVRASTQDD